MPSQRITIAINFPRAKTETGKQVLAAFITFCETLQLSVTVDYLRVLQSEEHGLFSVKYMPTATNPGAPLEQLERERDVLGAIHDLTNRCGETAFALEQAHELQKHGTFVGVQTVETNGEPLPPVSFVPPSGQVM